MWPPENYKPDFSSQRLTNTPVTQLRWRFDANKLLEGIISVAPVDTIFR